MNWQKNALGEIITVLSSGEVIRITPNAFGSKKVRLRGSGKIGQLLFNHQFYDSIKEAKTIIEGLENEKQDIDF